MSIACEIHFIPNQKQENQQPMGATCQSLIDLCKAYEMFDVSDETNKINWKIIRIFLF